jgi:uncharacterized membrane-anchored protein
MAEWRLTERARLFIVIATAAVVVVFVNVQIAGKERIVRDGATVLLRLAPLDPRSLMQGDYMALRYAIAERVAGAADAAGVRGGRIVLELDDAQRARFVALYEGQPLATNQQLLTFRKRGDTVRLASDAFFFEEGQFLRFARAAFGELRVSADGDAVLVGLRDDDGNPITDDDTMPQ